MFLKAGALSLALLVASRLLGLLRESAQAGAFGASGLADVVVLMLTLPDWVAGFVASGALAYVLLPAWAGCDRAHVAATQRRTATGLLALGVVLASLLVLFKADAVRWLAPGVPPAQWRAASGALVWSAVALPAALLAALWTTRLQHERDFTGMYGANLVVNAVLIAGILLAAQATRSFTLLGAVLLAAMLLRLAWLHWRTPQVAPHMSTFESRRADLPGPPVWLWAALSAGLPLALPFAARSIASQQGEGALATFNYAWKLVELPLVLAIQLVATLAFPRIAHAHSSGTAAELGAAVRVALALAWTFACAAAAALLAGAPAIASLLFGWGRMDPASLTRIGEWGALGAWGLLPQAVIAVALTVLAARAKMRIAVAAYAVALILLCLLPAAGWTDGGSLMLALNVLLAGVAAAVLFALGPALAAWLPWRALGVSAVALIATAIVVGFAGPFTGTAGLAAAVLAALLVLGAAWWSSTDLRAALAG